MDSDTIAFCEYGDYEQLDVASTVEEIEGDYMDFCDIFE